MTDSVPTPLGHGPPASERPGPEADRYKAMLDGDRLAIVDDEAGGWTDAWLTAAIEDTLEVRR